MLEIFNTVDFMDDSTETKQGIDKLNLMVRFMGVLDNPRKHLNPFKAWLVSQLKRGITAQEELNLMEGILKYVQSDPETNERMEAMSYLFELNFLEA